MTNKDSLKQSTTLLKSPSLFGPFSEISKWFIISIDYFPRKEKYVSNQPKSDQSRG